MSDLKIPIINNEGKLGSEEKVSESLFGMKLNKALISQAANKVTSNQRRARGKVKTRADVIGTTAKIWKQKGTGRARHGSRKANIFVGGGVSHGPTGMQNYTQDINQKMGQKAIYSLLSDKIRNNKLFVVDDIEVKKTKEANIFLKQAVNNLSLKGKIVLIQEHGELLMKFFGNLKQLKVININNLNVYDLLKTENIIFSKKSLAVLNSPTLLRPTKGGTSEGQAGNPPSPSQTRLRRASKE